MRINTVSFRWLPFLLITFSTVSAFAASSRLSGYVRDSHNGSALPGATVYLNGTSFGAATDLNGKYVINDVPAGSYVLRITYIGYEPKEVSIILRPGEDLHLDVKLNAVGVQGKNVVVTAQAAGQNAAINQQLSSMDIKNVVSAARIQSLPDANAAESVGRLPGISLIRKGGEGAQVVIRGLAPQYNQVEIDGVQMADNVTPSNPSSVTSGFGDRAVDLSMISSNMLGGISVTKAITPDMDAAVIGGVVNFKLREATSSVPHFHFLAQGGYDGLQNTYNDYKFVGSGEKRFANDKFGLFAEYDMEKIDLTSNVLGASYALKSANLYSTNPVYITSLNLTDVPRTRNRYDATVVMDYRLPGGKIDFMNFGSSGTTDQTQRGESYDIPGNTHSYSANIAKSVLSVMTNLLQIQKQISNFNIDAKAYHSYSETDIPNLESFTFTQNNAGLASHAFQISNPQQIPGLANDSLVLTELYGISTANSITRQRNLGGSLDIKTNINFSNEITSTIKFGGAYRYTTRSYVYTQADGDLGYGGYGQIKPVLEQQFPWMTPTLNSYGLVVSLFRDPAFSYGNFLGGQYPMGIPLNIPLLQRVLKITEQNAVLETWHYNSQVSIQSNYSGHEYRSAGYVMATVNFGRQLTLLPGVRYQNLVTRYTAPRGIITTGARYNYQYTPTTEEESHGFWLPMVHLRYTPVPWLQIHLAYTNTLAYPDFSAITPEMQVGLNTVNWHNYLLKPAHSANYDAVVSMYNNTIGLLSIDGFLKHINNLIFSTSPYVLDPSMYPGIPTYAVGYQIFTSLNNPYPVDVVGVEMDWQTHFWYLPGPLSGLVLSANYTHIFSKAKYPRPELKIISQYPYQAVVVDTFYTARLLDQPNDIANLALGYDYRGFSIRVSMLYEANVFSAVNFWPELRSYTAAYLRWDLAVNQRLPWSGLDVYMDLNNLNSARDIQVNAGSSFPEAEQHYGMTADLGVRVQI